MGKKWYTECSEAKHIFEQASDILKFDIARLCFEGDSAELAKLLIRSSQFLLQAFQLLQYLKRNMA